MLRYFENALLFLIAMDDALLMEDSGFLTVGQVRKPSQTGAEDGKLEKGFSDGKYRSTFNAELLHTSATSLRSLSGGGVGWYHQLSRTENSRLGIGRSR